MAVDEYSHRTLYRRLDDVLGPEDATRLMERLPQVPWVEMATKHDLGDMERRLVAEMRSEFRGQVIELTHKLYFGMAGIVFTAVSLSFAAARFGG